MSERSVVAQFDADTTIVVSLINGLGDTLLALPALRRLARAVGDNDRFFTWAAHDAIDNLLGDLPGLHIPLRVDRHAADLFLDPVADVCGGVTRIGLRDKVVWISLNAYSPCWPPDEMLKAALRPTHVVGFGAHPEVFRTDPHGSVIPMREQYLRVLGEAGPLTLSERRLDLSGEVRDRARRELVRLGIVSPYVAIHADTDEHKMWSRSAWTAVIDTLRRSEGVDVVAVGQPKIDYLPVPLVRGDWRQHAAIVAEARAFLGIDSCFAHVADVMQVPGIVLFGPSNASEWGCAGPAMRIVAAPEQNLEKLTPDDVIAHLRHVIAL